MWRCTGRVSGPAAAGVALPRPRQMRQGPAPAVCSLDPLRASACTGVCIIPMRPLLLPCITG